MSEKDKLTKELHALRRMVALEKSKLNDDFIKRYHELEAREAVVSDREMQLALDQKRLDREEIEYRKALVTIRQVQEANSIRIDEIDQRAEELKRWENKLKQKEDAVQHCTDTLAEWNEELIAKEKSIKADRATIESDAAALKERVEKVEQVNEMAHDKKRKADALLVEIKKAKEEANENLKDTEDKLLKAEELRKTLIADCEKVSKRNNEIDVLQEGVKEQRKEIEQAWIRLRKHAKKKGLEHIVEGEL